MSILTYASTAALLAIGVTLSAMADQPPAKIGRFPQEVATHFSEAEGLPSSNVLSVRIGSDGQVYAITDKGMAHFTGEAWEVLPTPNPENHLTQALFAAQIDRLFAKDPAEAAQNPALLPAAAVPNNRFYDALVREGAIYIAKQDGLRREAQFEHAADVLQDCAVYQLALSPANRLAAATSQGLMIEVDDNVFEAALVDDGMGRRWAAADVLAVAYDSDGRLWFATRAGVGCYTDAGWQLYTAAEGLPYNEFTCMSAGPGGVVWFGTRIGAIRFDGKEWAYRQGRAYLLDDHVRSIAIDRDGSVWFATPKGVSRIAYAMMTLAEKAAFYDEEVDKYIKRTPFGYTSEVRLVNPGDKSEIIYTDSDNDGLWTAMYGAGQCFAYAATKSPESKARAKQAFEALRFLQVVTQDCDHSPPKGYVARTILPIDGPDPNDGRLERDRQHRENNDSLWKLYEPRWPVSADGKWYWKSDTSSDELDGHYFFYPLYYDLVADTEEEKERARTVVRDLTDHMMAHGFNLVDFDGTPTRWGIYAPESLNHDTNWWVERGLKSLSMLSYLAVAEHMTGDPKYADAAKELIDKHGYQSNAMFPKLQFGMGSGNQSDDEMAFMCFYNLLKYTKDKTLRDMMTMSLYAYWTITQPEMNPFFNFVYAVFGQGATVTNPWGTHPIDPWPGWLADSVFTLKGFPLDRVSWGRKNSHRLDLIRLPRQQANEPTEAHRTDRGYRNNGKVLPVENRFFGHWNTDPWRMDYGGDGRELASGTVYLLPYYMGLYHGFITETE